MSKTKSTQEPANNDNEVLAVVTFSATEMIAFRTKDMEGDIWCEKAFLFNTQEEVQNFFKEDNNILLGIFFKEQDDRVLNNFKVYDNNPAKLITMVSFETKYAGNVCIYTMYKGFVCNCR